IMSITKEQHQALEDALVPREQCLMIGSCNYRLSTTFKPKEPTFQVSLDVLTLTPFYSAFLITASVSAVYMQKFWATITYQKHHIRFKMNKKSYSFDMETFRNMLLICPQLHGQKFVYPSFKEEILTFIRELGYPGNIKLLSDVKFYMLPQPWRTFGTIINKCLSGKIHPQHEVVQRYGAILPDYLTNLAMKESKATKSDEAPKPSSGKRVKATAKVAKSRKKNQPTPGLKALSDIALTKAEQMKMSIERSKTQLHISQPSGSGAHEGTGVTLGVPDVPIYGSDDEQLSWKSSDEEDDDDDEENVVKDEDDDDHNNDDEWTESDNDGEDFVHPYFSTHDDEARQEEVNKDDSFDLRVQTPSHVESTYDDNNDDEI
ncbi:hypothetical protein Tco_1047483, partial [Tanacetum coccineum]